MSDETVKKCHGCAGNQVTWEVLTENRRGGKRVMRTHVQAELAAWLMIFRNRFQRTLKVMDDGDLDDLDEVSSAAGKYYSHAIRAIDYLINCLNQPFSRYEWWAIADEMSKNMGVTSPAPTDPQEGT